MRLRRRGDVLLRYGDGLLDLSALRRAIAAGRFELGEIKIDAASPTSALYVARSRVERYKAQIVAGWPPIEPVTAIVDGPALSILDGIHRLTALCELHRARASAWLVPRSALDGFMLAPPPVDHDVRRRGP